MCSNSVVVGDFEFNCIHLTRNELPGNNKDSERYSLAAIAARNNATIVVQFLREVLNINVLHDTCSSFISSINCTYSKQVTSRNPNIWENAAWYPINEGREQVVYGQIESDSGELISLASSLTIVAHEFFHGVTYFGPKLSAKYGESGALNESYSDIFAVIIANRNQPYISQWNWEIGEPLTNSGFKVRNLQHPERYDQPLHYNNYKSEYTYINHNGDMQTESNVHFNNGIHNKAAYNIITATRNNSTELLFNQPGDLRKISSLFYRGLLSLKPSATFIDSGLSLIRASSIVFGYDPDRQQEVKQAIRYAFDLIGVSLP